MKKLLALVLTLFLLSGGHALAEPRKTGGITLSPVSQEIILKQDERERTGSFTVTNNNDTAETFALSAIDMGALDDTGGLVFSGLSQNYQQKYGLAKWVELARTSVTIAPKAKEAIGFTIKNDDTLAPGGHYGALIVRRAGSQTASSEQRVTLSPQAASLLFLRKSGGERYGLTLPNINSDHSIWHLPTKVSLPFKNEGNVHIVPRGVVRLKNSAGQELARGIINPESALILPEHTRTLSVALHSDAPVVWPGRYTIEADYRYDGIETTTHISQTFYTANLRVVLLLAGSLLVVCLFVYKTRRYLLRLPRYLRHVAARYRR